MRWIAALTAGILAAGSAYPNGAMNPRFEMIDASNSAMPASWRSSGDGGEAALDPDVKSDSGSRSVRLRKRSGAGFIGVLQHLPGKQWNGKTVLLRARFRAEDVSPGTLRLWMQVSAENFLSVAVPIGGSSEWVTRRLVLEVPEDANGMGYGATLTGGGTAWVADVELTETNAQADPLTPAAAAYVDEAIEKIRGHALRADAVDWDKARARALTRASGARTPEQAYDAIVYLVQSLKDNHSFFQPAWEARIAAENRRIDDFNLHSERVGRHALLRIPGFSQSHNDRQIAFSDDIGARIERLAESRPCGWVVDLREDTGGNMYPMLAGLWPFLGDETLGYFVRGESRTPWRVMRTGRHALPFTRARLVHAPVAVLTGPRTTSSGEAVALSFRGRPNTRAFGSPTNGRSTANRPYPMSDGARLLLMTAVMADRTGWLAGSAIPPDEEVASAKGPLPPSEDPVFRAAARWLDGQPSCTEREASKT